MSIDLGPVQATRKQSIARVEFFTDANLAQDDQTLRVHFEDADYDANGALIAGTQKFGTRVVERKFGQTKTDTQTVTDPVTGQSVTVSGAGLALLIGQFTYTYRAQDVAAGQ